MSNYGYLDVFQRVPWSSRYREPTVYCDSPMYRLFKMLAQKSCVAGVDLRTNQHLRKYQCWRFEEEGRDFKSKLKIFLNNYQSFWSQFLLMESGDLRSYGWMDDLQFYVLFNSFSHIRAKLG